MTWPNYSSQCRKGIASELRTPLVSAYRSNKSWGAGPKAGTHVARFERELEKAWGVKHAVAMNSGTMALTAAIKALRLPPHSDIVTTPFSFSATPASILLCGHRPVFADVDPHCFTLTGETVKKAITRKTRAILNVDLFGYLPDYKQFGQFGVPVIQDNCQAAGAVRDGKHLHGVIACGSGNGSKNLPCIEAGWAYTNDGPLAERMRQYISHGENFDSAEVGVNGRMNELIAVLARHGLKELESRNQRRRDLVSELERGIPAFQYDRFGHYSFYDAGTDLSRVFYVYPFWLEKTNRSRFIARCAKRGLPVGAGYITPPLHHYKAFKKYATKQLPVVDELSSKTLCILSTLTPDRPLSYAKWCAKVIREALE